MLPVNTRVPLGTTMVTLDQLAASFDPGHLNLFLLPTEQCNFRCTYCYEDFKIGRMQPVVVDAVKALLDKRFPSLSGLEISWFGGEPLLAKAVIEEISSHIVDLATARPVNYRANMTTNGYFLDIATASRLSALGITFYQISLDGPADTHNRTRVGADGSGTFAHIWANLESIGASDLDVTVVLRVHFSPDTYRDLCPLIEAINATFGKDRRFFVFFKAIERLGGPNDRDISTFSRDEKQEIKHWLVAQLSRPTQAHDIVACGDTYICYAAKPNSLVIRANGDVAKCTVALYDDRNRVGRLLPNGDIAIDQPKVRWWMRGFESLRQEELTCPHGADKVPPRPLVSLASD